MHLHLHTRTLYECEWDTSESLSWGIGYKDLREKEIRDGRAWKMITQKWMWMWNKVGVCSEAWWVIVGGFDDKNSLFRHDKQELCRRHPGEYSWVAIMHSDLEFNRGIRTWKSPGDARERKPAAAEGTAWGIMGTRRWRDGEWVESRQGRGTWQKVWKERAIYNLFLIGKKKREMILHGNHKISDIESRRILKQ